MAQVAVKYTTVFQENLKTVTCPATIDVVTGFLLENFDKKI